MGKRWWGRNPAALLFERPRYQGLFTWFLWRGSVEGPAEEVGQARVEDAQVLRAGDTVALVFEGEEFVGDILALQGFRNGVNVILCDVRVLQTLDDQEVPLDVLYGVDRGPCTVTVGDILGGTAHHLLAVGPEVGTRGVVVDGEVGHTADGGCGGDGPGFEVR